VKSLIESVEKGHLDKAMINNEVFSKHLYTRYYPDPDLLIRTSGETEAVELPAPGRSVTPSSTSPTSSGPISASRS